MNEAKNEYKIDFGPYSVELKASQVYFRKNNSLMKAMPVKSTFGLYDLKKLAKKVANSVNMASKLPKDVLKANHDNINERDMGYYVWSGTYGQDKPKKMKGFQYVKDLKSSMKATQDNKKKYGNARAMIAYEFEKEFPKAFKALVEMGVDFDRFGDAGTGLDEKRNLLRGFGGEGESGEEVHKGAMESTASWEKALKDMHREKIMSKLSKKDKETLLKIQALMSKQKKEANIDGPVTKAYDQTIDTTNEDFVRSGHMYKSLTYKVKDAKAVMAAYKKFKAGNRTINMVVKSSGDTVTISGHPTKGMWMSPSIADQLDAAIQKTGKATLVKSDSKKLKENKMNESEIKFRKMIREIAEPMLKSAMNEKAVKGKDAGNFIKMANAGKKLTMNGKTYTALGKGKWKGPDGKKLSWIEVSSMASALGNKEVTYENRVNEISVKAGLQDVIKGRTTSIEGIKFSKELADNLMYWINTSPYGRKYGKHILKGRIASLIGPANAMGFGDRLKGKLKGEWKAIVAKHGPKREAVIEQLQALKEEEGEGQVMVYDYQTKHFDICPGAQSLYKRIQDEDLAKINNPNISNEQFVMSAAKMQDSLFALEKDAMERGSTAHTLFAAECLAAKTMKLAKMMNLEAEHNYVQGHVDKIKEKMLNERKLDLTIDLDQGIKELNEMSDSQMLKMAMKGAKAARVGNTATRAYIDSLKNSWRLDPRSKKDYKDFSIDDWEEDVLYYIQNKG